MTTLGNRPHIVHILGSLRAGGAQRSVLSLCRSEQLSGFRHSVISILGAHGEFLPAFQAAEVPVYECPVRWPKRTPIPSYRINKTIRDQGWRTFEWRLSRLLRELNTDLVNTHVTTNTYSQARAAIKRLNVPWIWTVRGLYRSRGLEEQEWPDVMDLVQASPAKIIGVSQAALNDLNNGHFNLMASKQGVIYNAVDIDALDAANNREDWRAKWNIPQQAVVFGTAGRLIPLKRHDLLIDAAGKLVPHNPLVHLVIAGDGPSRKQLQDQISKANLDDHVHLVGFQEIGPLLASLDVFVLPSDTEALPNALIEALATGTPCIGTLVGGIPEVLGHGGGILIEKGSLDDLVDAMHVMLDPITRRRYADQARTVAQQFSIEKTASQYATIYRQLLEEARAK